MKRDIYPGFFEPNLHPLTALRIARTRALAAHHHAALHIWLQANPDMQVESFVSGREALGQYIGRLDSEVARRAIEEALK